MMCADKKHMHSAIGSLLNAEFHRDMVAIIRSVVSDAINNLKYKSEIDNELEGLIHLAQIQAKSNHELVKSYAQASLDFVEAASQCGLEGKEINDIRCAVNNAIQITDFHISELADEIELLNAQTKIDNVNLNNEVSKCHDKIKSVIGTEVVW